MSTQTITSAMAPVITGSGKSKLTTYIATKVTGPVKDAAGSETFLPEIVQYASAAGGTATTIGSRDAGTGEITWNSAASAIIQANTEIFKKASNNQMLSIESAITSTAAQRAGLNAAAGAGNRETSQGNESSRPSNNSRGGFTGLGAGSKPSKMPRESYNKSLCYPEALRRSTQDTVRISVLKYEPRTLGGGNASGRTNLGFADRSSWTGRVVGAVTLPVPGGVQDSAKVEWGPGTMTAMQIATSDAVKSFLSTPGAEGAQAATDSVKSSIEAAREGGADVSTGLSNFFTEQLTGATDLQSRLEGQIMNPNMELLFKNPSLRAFNFSWRLSPRDERESMTIMRIIRMFKQSMAPKKTVSQLFLKAPNTYKVAFQSPYGGKNHRFLPKVKECAMINFDVNYTPDGNYMTYDNSSMVSYEMSMSFQEIEPLYNNDMGMRDGDIGF